MSRKYKLVQNDTLPEVCLFLQDQSNGNVIDLSDSSTTVMMHFADARTRVVKETLVLAKLVGTVVDVDEDTGEQTTVFGEPYLLPGSGGRCVVQWSPTALDAPGEFVGELEIVFSDGRRLSGYDLLAFSVRPQVG